MKNKIFNLNVPLSLRRTSWIRDHDFDPWFKILTWATAISSEDKLILRILLRRIQKMYISQGRRRNLRFVYSYLKEAYTICVSIKTQSPYTPKMGVRVGTQTGIPLIVPGRIRERMMSDRRLYITVMTMLGIHRIIPWWPAVDLGSIRDEFSGRFKTIPAESLRNAKRKLMMLMQTESIRFTSLKAGILMPQSAGPNARTAYWGVFRDTIGIVKYPSYWVKLSLWFWHTGSWSVLGIFLLQSLIASLFVLWSIIGYYMNKSCNFLIGILADKQTSYLNFYLENYLRFRWYVRLFIKEPSSYLYCYIALYPIIGFLKLITRIFTIAQWDMVNNVKLSRLSVVYNTAGKARVIGITNYWVQCAMYPLHKEIFRLLRRLPTDGTFNQLSPIWALQARGKRYYSYDLTAATDRLPREVQRDVLSTIVGDQLSTLWASLMDMPFSYDEQIIKYSVGQPMGAYSSWAMLALTHHYIVQSYYSHEPEMEYAILGDDVVVPEYLSGHYYNIMTGLGVSISFAKSIVSGEMVEFAKRVRTLDGEDLSIIGPGLIMAAVRDRWVAALTLAEACNKGLQRWTNAPEILKLLPGSKPGDSVFGSLVLFGPRPLIKDSHVSAVLPPGKARAISDPAGESKYVRSYMLDFFLKRVKDDYETKIRNCLRSVDILKMRLVSHLRDCLPISKLIPGLLKFLSLLLDPTTWYIIRESISTLWLEERPTEVLAQFKGDSLMIIQWCLARTPELIWGLDSVPTHQKVVSSRRFYKRWMDSFPWMDGLKPRVTIPVKNSSLNRGEPFLEERYPGLYNPMGIGMKPNITISVEGAPVFKPKLDSKQPFIYEGDPSHPGERGTWQNHDGHDLSRERIGYGPDGKWRGMFGKHF